MLDGLEPLQSGHVFDRGKLRDPALDTLLRGLARHSEGLCLITTREPLSDFAGVAGVTARDLEQITPEAGRALLRTARVVGTDADLEGLAKRFGPHALAVSLLGVYLYENDPRHGTGAVRVLEQLPGSEPVDRVLAGFEQWLAASAEWKSFDLLGLFDWPADAGCLGALRAKPLIPGLTDRVIELSDAGWDRVLDRLEKLRLVHLESKHAGPPVVDAHPLLREHFAEAAPRAAARGLAGGAPAALRAPKASVPYRPEGLAGLQPLYQAVAHGCKAGLHQQACAEVYRDRILRGTGTTGSTARRSSAPSAPTSGRSLVFSRSPGSGSPLGCPSRPGLAAQRSGLPSPRPGPADRITGADAGERWHVHRARRTGSKPRIRASNLSELELTLGELAAAVRDAEQSVEFADRSGDALPADSQRARRWPMPGISRARGRTPSPSSARPRRCRRSSSRSTRSSTRCEASSIATCSSAMPSAWRGP